MEPRSTVWEQYWEGRRLETTYPAVSDVVEELLRAVGALEDLRILEVGPGSGRDAARLCRTGARVTALETSPAALRHLAAVAPAAHGVLGDGTRAPFADWSFDVVLHQGLLEHFRDPGDLLRENRRLLRPGGTLLVDVPQRWHPYTLLKHLLMATGSWFAGWETEYSPRQLCRVVTAAGFRPVATYGYFMEPGLAYRVLREALRRIGLDLPLDPWLGGWRHARRPIAEALRALARSRVGPWVTHSVGVVASKVPRPAEPRAPIAGEARSATADLSEHSLV